MLHCFEPNTYTNLSSRMAAWSL
uniref:Uncharacterized protein n=1 Tax=Arundo donax TaxID=35708 RepID=A0A0A9FDZ7_ARUDO